jgi:hypothetical protein
MKIRFNIIEIDIVEDKPQKEETWSERVAREHREFQEEFDRRSRNFHNRMRNDW